jgi:signal transduction histidine kinase
VRKDGTHFWVSTVVTRVRDVPQCLAGFGVVARDITERRSREEEIRRRADELGVLNQQKDDFLAMLAHELRNPLGAVSNAIHVIERAGPGDAAYERAKQIAKRQIQHQMRLVEDLLDASRLLRGKVQMHPERLDLTRLVRNTVEDFRSSIEEAQLSLTVELPSGPVWTSGDPTRLAQVVGNLLQNAAKFTPPGGQVVVSLGDGGILTVRDTGMGLSPGIQPLIFEPFAQADRSLDRSKGGLGLGLALVKGIVELHGGTVAARSRGLGHGTEFEVALPTYHGPADRAPASLPLPASARTRRVLVVEDSRDGAATLADLLELSGHAVTIAGSGPEALRIAVDFNPEVVLCDIGLPGMSGYEVAQALRRKPPPSLRLLVAITGYGGAEDRQRSHAAGFDIHLTKPVDVEELQQLIIWA